MSSITRSTALAAFLGCAMLLGGCGSTPAVEEGPAPDARPLERERIEAAAEGEGDAPRDPLVVPRGEGPASSHVLAYVNGQVLTYRDLLLRIGPQLSVIEDERARAMLEQKEALDLIRNRLVDSAAEEEGVTVARSEIDAEVKAREAELAKNGATLAAFLAERDMTRRELEEQIRSDLRMQKYMSALIGRGMDPAVRVRAIRDTFVSPGQARKYYDRHPERFRRPELARVRLLSISTDYAAEDRVQATNEARRRAQSVVARLRGGEDWVPVFRSVYRSAEDRPADDGLMEIGRGEKADWIEEFAFGDRVKKGDVELVEKGSTFYVLQSEGWEGARTVRYDEVDEQIRRDLSQALRYVATYEVELALLEDAVIRPQSIADRLRRILSEGRKKLLMEFDL